MPNEKDPIVLEGRDSPLRWRRGEFRRKPDEGKCDLSDSNVSALFEAAAKYEYVKAERAEGSSGEEAYSIQEADSDNPKVAAIVINSYCDHAIESKGAVPVTTVFRAGPASPNVWDDEKEKWVHRDGVFVKPCYGVHGFVAVVDPIITLTKAAAKSVAALVNANPDIVSVNFDPNKEALDGLKVKLRRRALAAVEKEEARRAATAK